MNCATVIVLLTTYAQLYHCLFIKKQLNAISLTDIRTDDVNSPGNMLMLTPMIKKNDIDNAKKWAKVDPFINTTENYAGFLTVDEKYNSNLFFWFFYAQENCHEAPLMLWLQGGPGASSLFGLFMENGPYNVDDKLQISAREHSWSKYMSMLYIDSPVGTGFSFADDDKGYSKTEDDVAKNLYEALQQFLRLFPDLQKVPFFISGESYAGKYIPAIAYMIHQKNYNAEIKINIQGIAIGNGFCDPKNMIHYSDYLYNIGLIKENDKKKFDEKEQEAIKYIDNKQFKKAFTVYDEIILGDKSITTLYKNITGLSTYYNYVDITPIPMVSTMRLVQQNEIRKKIHVGNSTFHVDNKVEEFLIEDFMQSVVPWLEELVEIYRILIYNGQLDVIIPYTSTQSFIRNMNWSGAENYRHASRHTWYINNTIAGYWTNVKKLTDVLVLNAGHLVPKDKPASAYDLITKFVSEKPLG